MTKMTRTLTASLLALTAFSGAALASDLDADSDGMVTYEEVVAMYPDVSEEAFAAIDSDESGALDEDELAAAVEAGTIPAE